MGNQIFLTVLSLSVSGTLTGLLILCIRPLTKRFFSQKWNYYIWLVMAVRLLLPISLGINLTGYLFAMEKAKFTEMESVEIAETMKEAETLEAPEAAVESGHLQNDINVTMDRQQTVREKSLPSRGAGKPLLSYLWLIWLSGVFLAACIKGIRYRRFVVSVKNGSREIRKGRIREAADQLSQKLGIRRTVPIYESPLISGPILIGLWNPCMILPADGNLTEICAEGSAGYGDISLILHHELIHYKKKDLWYKWLYQAVLCIHWFNPLLFLFGQKMNRDCELACDEAVMGILTPEGRKAYGNVLLDAAEQKLDYKSTVLFTTLLEDKGTLKERLGAILQYKRIKGIRVAFSICLLGTVMLLAGFAGASDGGRQSGSTSFGYMSLWDGFGEAVGRLWDGIGQMWGNLGEALSDVDQDLGQTRTFDTNGEAWKVYEDDAALAGEDIHDAWFALYYMGIGAGVDCRGFVLNGSDTHEILYAKEAFTQKADLEAELTAGRMKLIHVGADGTVTQLAELKEGEKLCERIDISLTKGRNVVKIVGQGAEIKKLHLKFGNQKSKNILNVFGSETEEASERICSEFREGKIDVERFLDSMPYMEDEDLRECTQILFDSGADLTTEQISWLMAYADAEAGTYLADAVEKGVMRPFTGSEITESLIYYLSSADILRLVENMDEALSFEMLKELAYYLDDADLEKCLNRYLEQGNKLSYEEFTELSYFLSEDTIKRLDKKRT